MLARWCISTHHQTYITTFLCTVSYPCTLVQIIFIFRLFMTENGRAPALAGDSNYVHGFSVLCHTKLALKKWRRGTHANDPQKHIMTILPKHDLLFHIYEGGMGKPKGGRRSMRHMGGQGIWLRGAPPFGPQAPPRVHLLHGLLNYHKKCAWYFFRFNFLQK